MHKSIVLSKPSNLPIFGMGLAVYFGIQEMAKASYLPVVFTPKTLCYHIFKKIDTYKVREVKDALKEFNFLNKIGSDCYTCTKDDFKADKFTSITPEEFRTIINSGKKNAVALLEHFVHLVRSFDFQLDVLGEKSIIGHMPCEYFAKTYRIGINSVVAYNKELQDLGLIYMRRQTNFKDSIYLPNLYCRAEDSEFLDVYLTKF